MEYTEFLEELRAGMEKQMGDRYKILLKTNLKENGKRVRGLAIIDCIINSSAPVIYGEAYYQEYLEHNNIQKCIEDIISVYNECKNTCFDNIQYMGDWKKCNKWIYPFIIKIDANKELLEKLVYRQYLDFAICYMIRLPQEESDSYTISKVTSDILQLWRIDKDELHNVAINNLKEDGYKIVDMLDIVNEILGEVIEDEVNKCEMYVLSNKYRHYGAAGILDEERLEKFAAKVESDFYILPSSLHEVILIPCSDKSQSERFNQMVREVNDELVDISEILSDHAYYYDRKKKEISIAV